jgi:hypothetical protein
MAMRALLVCCLTIIACQRTPDVKRATARPPAGTPTGTPATTPSTAPASQQSTPSSNVADDDTTDVPLPDSIVSRVTALEDSLARDSLGPRAPIWLWKLGTLTKTSLGGMPGTGHYGEYARAHRVQYDYSEPDAAFVYNGYHFAELAWRFPHDTLAARAAYALTQLDIVGECEGWVDCYIRRSTFPLREFMERFPDSPLVRDAVRSANDAFDGVLSYKPGPNDAWEVDSDAVRAEIAGYDSTAMVLSPSLRALALPTIERLRSQWGRPRRDTAHVEPGGIAVDFRDVRCGVAFKHPDGWDVIQSPQRSCAFEIRRRDRKPQPAHAGDVESYAVTVSVSSKSLNDGLHDAGFRKDSGEWVATASKGRVIPERTRAGAAWHGLTGFDIVSCQEKDDSHNANCDLPFAYIGNDARSARIVAGRESTAVYDLVLRTISFP